ACVSGSFSKPYTGIYVSDFRTSAGDTCDSFFGISALGNPNGMVSRIHYNSSTKTHVKSKDTWAGLVDSLVQSTPVTDIQIINNFNSSDSTTCIHVQTEFLTPSLSGKKYNLVVLLIQDSIIDYQK